MTVHNLSLLAPQTPTSSVSTEITIGHVQLRDLVICPHTKGVVNYLHDKAIYEHDLFRPGSKRVLAVLPFKPNTLAALPIPDSVYTLVAAGGQDADLHLSMHDSAYIPSSRRRFSQRHWQYNKQLKGSINNSVMLTSLSLTKSHVSSVEPRLAVSNNDCTVKFFDVNIRDSKNADSVERTKEIGSLKIDVPVNHSSVSPDGSTLLCVGDSPQVHLHHLSGSSRLTFERIATYSLVPYNQTALTHQYPYSHHASSPLPASFSTAFSPDGVKFAVASQEGVAVVWDVRSSKPLKVYETNKTRGRERRPTGEASGLLYDEDSWDWSRSGARAPGWGIRSIKFTPLGSQGRELMTFTEHTSLLHVIDARTFETEEIIRIPDPLAASTRSSPGHRPTRSESAIVRSIDFSRPRIEDSPYVSATEEEEEGVVVIGSTTEEEDVRLLLGRHGIRTARRSRHSFRRMTHHEDDDVEMSDTEERDGRYEDYEMEFDVDTECLSSASDSRAGSPMPAVHSFGPTFVHYLPAMAREHTRSRSIRSVSSSLSGNPRLSRQHPPYPTPSRLTPLTGDEQKESSPIFEDSLDLVGTCFDPTGSYLYVGSVKGIVEYRIRGAEKKWWMAPQWA